MVGVVNTITLLGKFVGDHAGGDGAEKLIVISCLHGNGNFDLCDLFGKSLGIGKIFGTAFCDESLAGLNEAQDPGGGFGSQTAGDQIVTGVPGFDNNFITGKTELGDVVEQNQSDLISHLY